ncbi:hypothetical protein NPIL_135501, partial [Nephila pilipes]
RNHYRGNNNGIHHTRDDGRIHYRGNNIRDYDN